MVGTIVVAVSAYTDWAPRLRTPKKIAWSQHLHNNLFAGRIDHSKLHTAFLNVDDILRGIALREDGFFSSKLGNLSPQSVRFKKQFHIEDSSL